MHSECLKCVHLQHIYIMRKEGYVVLFSQASYFQDTIDTVRCWNPWICMLVWIYIDRTFFSSTLPQPVHAWIEWKWILADFVRKYGWKLIKIKSIRNMMFLYYFYICNISGTLGMFYTCPGRLRMYFTLGMVTWSL